MRPRASLALLVLGSTLAAGCGLLLDLGNLSGGKGTGGAGTGGGASSSSSSSGATSSSGSSTSSSASSSGTGGGDAGPPSDAGDGGPIPPVKPPVTINNGMVDFKIDATEVTAAQYLVFVKAFEKSPPVQRDVCMWNKSVEPNVAPLNDAGITPSSECQSYDLAAEAQAHPDSPVRCIDWCDAAAYCTWAGGWMCHGNEGKPYPVEWKTACEGPSQTAFPYGATYVAGNCVDSPATQPQDVATKPKCEGGYPGVFDMSGNVGEWLDCGCEYDDPDPTKTNAYVGGGGFSESGAALGCNPMRTASLVGFFADIGARCCYKP